jgi:hypothetical protein
MAAKRYAVVDANGKVINHILINDPLPKGYWPGYGTNLVPLEQVDLSNGGGGLDIVTFDKWPVIPQIGDTVNLATGAVTKFVPEMIMQKDGDGEDIQVASAPDVKLTQEVAAKSEGTISVKVQK